MEKLAIIGSGVSGLGAAFYLRNLFDIEIFEQNDYVGGHTNTLVVQEPEQELPVDTGFIVYNEVTYPNLVRLFADLQVPTHDSDMSFSMFNCDSGLQFNGQNLSGIFSQRRNLLSPRFLKLLWQANRFNNEAPRDLAANRAEAPLGEYLRKRGYNDFFIYNYIVPMGSAVWSTPVDKMLAFPARTMIRFFQNHGFLGLTTQLQWRTVTGGSFQYVQRILAELARPVRTGEGARSVRRLENGRALVRTDRGEYEFDRVLIAAHGDQALRMLEEPREQEAELLGRFRYERNQAILHTDASVMPPLKRVWSSWNYKSRRRPGAGDPADVETATVYWMNRLQKLPTQRNYFVSINEFADVDPEKTIRVIDYEHPLFDGATAEAQQRLQDLNADGPVYFSGSYFRYGFHEDALMAGLAAAEAIGRNADEKLQLLSV